MLEDELSQKTMIRLERVSVATLATALFRRGLRHQVIQDVRPVSQRKEHGRSRFHIEIYAGTRRSKSTQ